MEQRAEGHFTKSLTLANEAFSDSSTMSGRWVGLKAKFLELFQRDLSKQTHVPIHPDELYAMIEKVRKDLDNTDGDSLGDVSYIKIQLPSYLVIDSTIVKEPVKLQAALKDAVALLKARNQIYIPESKAFIKAFTNAIKARASDDEIIKLRKGLTFTRLKPYVGKKFIAAIEMATINDPDTNAVIVAPNYPRFTYKNDPISLHVSPYKREEIAKFFPILESMVAELSPLMYVPDGYSDVKLYDNPYGNTVDELMSEIDTLHPERLKENGAIMRTIRLDYSLFSDYIAMSGILLQTFKAVIRLLESSIRRYH